MDLHPGYLIDPAPSQLGDQSTLLYNGILTKAGAAQIYLHLGYGRNLWHHVKDIPMEKTPAGWRTTVEINHFDQVNFCFHDNANHWDNNSGLNWSYPIKP